MPDRGDEAYLRSARTWLDEHAPAFSTAEPALTIFPDIDDAAHAEIVHRARAWEAHKARHGWAGPAVPVDLGGGGRRLATALRFEDEESRHGLPLDVFAVSRGMVLPTLLAWADAGQRRRLVPRMLDGRDLWCQLFSEPGAGSDLAAVSTRARRDGDGWVISGEKVWTSFGHDADMGYLLARSDPDVARHAGLTAFVLPMDAPGVHARPIRQPTGAQTFSQVHLDGVRLPADAVLGAPGGGWKVVHTTLMNERLALGSVSIPVDALEALAVERGLDGDRQVRRDLARIRSRKLVVDLVRARLLDEVASGVEPGPEGSMAKILVSRGAMEASEVATRLLGADAALAGRWADQALGSLGLAIGGGTEEILKSLIGERALGLPREPRPAGAAR